MSKGESEQAVALNPCPFCGAAPSLTAGTDPFRWMTCSDPACEADGPIRISVQSAMEAWNARIVIREPQ